MDEVYSSEVLGQYDLSLLLLTGKNLHLYLLKCL